MSNTWPAPSVNYRYIIYIMYTVYRIRIYLIRVGLKARLAFPISITAKTTSYNKILFRGNVRIKKKPEQKMPRIDFNN